ncbi:putative WRKY transcription factor 70 [Dorcoceras hygrometricum]|uniref:Putative WRKY transcription factor 70 n=1 Tax=Dorcoceras hygrometricum TaxID=472368 RepID=A0A2Z7BJW1_9LAMI|nr:putative WRKY transcription factor 70 [Dorcoceras hygrometricum]
MRNLNDNLHAMERRLMEELVQGKSSAIILQTLLHNPFKDEGSISREELAMKILRSFNNSISIASSCASVVPSAQISGAVDCGGGGGSTSSGGRMKKTAKDRRGCYKRKRPLDSWTKVSPTIEDGGAWRKYGQKQILNSKYPRCYYRCTHKSQGCKAKKQVQKMKEDPLYQTTYFNHHTCTGTQAALPQHIVELDQIESNLLSFQGSKNIHYPKPANASSLKQEFENVGTQTVGIPYAKSSANTSSWLGNVGPGPSRCKQVFSPGIPVPGDDLEEEVSGLYSCASMDRFHGLDMEVDQLGDIDFDEMYNGNM